MLSHERFERNEVRILRERTQKSDCGGEIVQILLLARISILYNVENKRDVPCWGRRGLPRWLSVPRAGEDGYPLRTRDLILGQHTHSTAIVVSVGKTKAEEGLTSL